MSDFGHVQIAGLVGHLGVQGFHPCLHLPAKHTGVTPTDGECQENGKRGNEPIAPGNLIQVELKFPIGCRILLGAYPIPFQLAEADSMQFEAMLLSITPLHPTPPHDCMG